MPPETPSVTICVLTYGDHAPLLKRSLGSVLSAVLPERGRVVAGANAPGAESLSYLRENQAKGRLDRLVVGKIC